MYKTVLVHVDADDPASAGRIEVAARIAADGKGILVGVAARLSDAAIAVLTSNGAMVGGFLSNSDDDLEATFAAGHRQFTEITAEVGIQTAWRTAVDFPAQALINIAGMADLIVVGGQKAKLIGGDYMAVDVGELILLAGRPVLTVPPDVTRLDLGGAVIAWRNTREARRAIVDALPLLAMADPVTLVHVPDARESQASLADAISHLAGHGIKAVSEVSKADNEGAGHAIIDFAKRSQAGLIVCGAYGHTRAREWVLGGVTRDLTRQDAVPTLLSH